LTLAALADVDAADQLPPEAVERRENVAGEEARMVDLGAGRRVPRVPAQLDLPGARLLERLRLDACGPRLRQGKRESDRAQPTGLDEEDEEDETTHRGRCEEGVLDLVARRVDDARLVALVEADGEDLAADRRARAEQERVLVVAFAREVDGRGEVPALGRQAGEEVADETARRDGLFALPVP